MIAVGVLVVGLLGLISTLIFSTNSTFHGLQISKANNHARALMEQIRINNLPFGTSPPANWNDASASSRLALGSAPYNAVPYQVSNEDGFTRNVQVAYNGDNDVATITVTVYWFEKEVEKSVELVANFSDPSV